MATVTIRGVDEKLKARLRSRAVRNGTSMEAEARAILRAALAPPRTLRQFSEAPQGDAFALYLRVREIVEPIGGIELDLPPRGPMRDPPDFGRR